MDTPTTVEQRALRCPWCGGGLIFGYVYDGLGYSEHRTVDSIECDECDATWNAAGEPTSGPRWVEHPGLYTDPAAPPTAPPTAPRADRSLVFTWSYMLDDEHDENGGCWPDHFQVGVSEIVFHPTGGTVLSVCVETTGEVFNLPFDRDPDLTDVHWIDAPADDSLSVLVARTNPTRSIWSGWQWQPAAQPVQPGWHAFINSDGSPPTTHPS